MYRTVGEKTWTRVLWSIWKRSSFKVMTCSLSVQSQSDEPVWWTPVNCDFRCRNLRAKVGTEESYSYFLWYSEQYRGRNGLLYSHYFLFLFNWLEIWERKNRKKKKGRGRERSGRFSLGVAALGWFIMGQGKLSISSIFSRKDVMSCNNNLVTIADLFE